MRYDMIYVMVCANINKFRRRQDQAKVNKHFAKVCVPINNFIPFELTDTIKRDRVRSQPPVYSTA